MCWAGGVILIQDGYIDQFMMHWNTIHRHLRKGTLTEGAQSITRLQWMLLRHLQRSNDTTIGNIANKFGVRPSTVSQMTDRLEKAGLVERISGREDGRQKEVRLTSRGEALIYSVESVWAERLIKGLNQFTEAERAQLLQLLSRLSASMQDADRAVDLQLGEEV